MSWSCCCFGGDDGACKASPNFIETGLSGSPKQPGHEKKYTMGKGAIDPPCSINFTAARHNHRRGPAAALHQLNSSVTQSPSWSGGCSLRRIRLARASALKTAGRHRGSRGSAASARGAVGGTEGEAIPDGRLAVFHRDATWRVSSSLAESPIRTASSCFPARICSGSLPESLIGSLFLLFLTALAFFSLENHNQLG
jgi:hypothetical protein